MPYDQPLFRPPSEAHSFILQVTLGCSHNQCTFCGMYRSKRFRPQPLQTIRQAIDEGRRALGPDVARVFLADGDAFCLSARRLEPILEDLNQAFSRLQRISAYANARDILAKSPEELIALRQKKLRLLYLGLESGDDVTLERIRKGATTQQMVSAAARARDADIGLSVMVLIGLAGSQRSLDHARASAAVINQMQPRYTALLTYTPVPGTPLFREMEQGTFALPSPQESLREIREFLFHLDCRTYFTCNHASNYLPLTGRLPSAKDALLQQVELALQGQIQLKPEFLRGL